VDFQAFYLGFQLAEVGDRLKQNDPDSSACESGNGTQSVVEFTNMASVESAAGRMISKNAGSF
jgi:hypothetical protein